MNAGENKPTGLVKDMDTSILNTLSLIAPDLMEEMELRALILSASQRWSPSAGAPWPRGCIWRSGRCVRRRKR